MHPRRIVLMIVIGTSLIRPVPAYPQQPPEQPSTTSGQKAAVESRETQIRSAVARSIALIEHSVPIYLEARECFSCHHQAIPVLALQVARRRGLDVKPELIDQQLKRTFAHLESGRERYREGKGQGGKADTAGYALWTLAAGGHQSDDMTALVVEYLLNWQADQGRWSCTSNRPPSEVSDFTTTYLALRAASKFATDKQHERVQVRRRQVSQWLDTAEPQDTEDHVFRLRLLKLLDAPQPRIAQAVDALRNRQGEDGGWAQTDKLASDAYATATVLDTLLELDIVKPDDDVCRRAVTWLLDQQADDGSWFVKSRSRPFQVYFESGFPHEHDQFISVAATAWATRALARCLPPTEPVAAD